MAGRLESILEGTVSGAAATLPMSAVMIAADRLGLMGRQPPEVITTKALTSVGKDPPEPIKRLLSATVHLGVGTAAGGLFGMLRRETSLSLPGGVQGIAFGLLVYTVSYAGVLPALRILPMPHEDRRGRSPAMIVAHVVYGAALGLLLPDRPSHDGL